MIVHEFIRAYNGTAIVKYGSHYFFEDSNLCYSGLDDVLEVARKKVKLASYTTNDKQVEEMYALGLVRESSYTYKDTGVTVERWGLIGDPYRRGFDLTTNGELIVKAQYHHQNSYVKIDLEEQEIVLHTPNAVHQTVAIDLKRVVEILGVKIKNIEFRKN